MSPKGGNVGRVTPEQAAAFKSPGAVFVRVELISHPEAEPHIATLQRWYLDDARQVLTNRGFTLAPTEAEARVVLRVDGTLHLTFSSYREKTQRGNGVPVGRVVQLPASAYIAGNVGLENAAVSPLRRRFLSSVNQAPGTVPERDVFLNDLGESPVVRRCYEGNQFKTLVEAMFCEVEAHQRPEATTALVLKYKELLAAVEAHARTHSTSDPWWYYRGTTEGIHHFTVTHGPAKYETVAPEIVIGIQSPAGVPFNNALWRRIQSPVRTPVQ